jgi:hypothetical protein
VLETRPETTEETFGRQMQIQSSRSASQARAILGAWQSGDKQRLSAELERLPAPLATDAAEEERLELLCEVANELRMAGQPFDDKVCGSLLAHLAFSSRSGMSAGCSTVISSRRAAAAVLVQ